MMFRNFIIYTETISYFIVDNYKHPHEKYYLKIFKN